MKKNILLSLLFVCVINSFGQHGQNMTPNFTPPSPEAFTMTKYGDVPIDEFNGKVQLNIPIYQYKSGQLTLPISANYYGAGVKVDDLPTQIGVNWLLEAGGVITREIRDKPDEYPVRINITDEEINTLNQLDCTVPAEQLRTILENTGNDTEADIFRFHLFNYSGSFYLDDNLKAQLVKNEQNLKIDIQGNLSVDKTFVITDPEGIKYYFGGSEASEQTRTRTVLSGGGGITSNAIGITSFYLFKIQHPINGTIFLQYDTLPMYIIALNNSYSLTKSVQTDLGGDCSGSTSDQQLITTTQNVISDQKLLKRIYSDDHNEIIVFNRTTIDNNSFKSYLNNIEIRKDSNLEDFNGMLLSKIEFEYFGLENPLTASRFFLTKVIKDKALQSLTEPGKKYEEYKMEYNKPDLLPERFSKKIDMLGYFNGINNTSLYPCFNDAGLDCPNRKAIFTNSSRGVLSRIYYPTGGYTDFEYEPQPGITSGTQTIDGSLFFNQDVPSERTGEVPVVPNIGTRANIDLTCSDYNEYANHWAKFVLEITDLTVSPITIRTEQASHGVRNFTYDFIPNHNYKIQYKLVLPTSSNINGYAAEGRFSIVYPNNSIPTEGAGVRIKRISNVAYGDIQESKKRFYYKAYDKLNSRAEDLFEFMPRKSMSGTMKSCPFGTFFGSMIPVITQTLYSDYSYSDFNCSNIKYRESTNVTVSYGGDDFEQGGVEKTFLVTDKEADYFEVTPKTTRAVESYQSGAPNSKYNNISLDGLVTKEKTFKNVDNAIFKIREKIYKYDYPLIAKRTNIYGYKLYDFANLPNIYIVLEHMTIPYSHNGFLDCLNPNSTNRCNCCNYEKKIYDYMFEKMRDKLQTENSPLFANFDAKIASGNYVVHYSFNRDYNSATILLKELTGICTMSNTLSNYFIGGYYTKSYDFMKTSEKETLYIDPVPANLVAVDPIEAVPGDPTQEQLEDSYKKITTTKSYKYGGLKGLPTIITTDNSDGAVYVTKYYYSNDASALGLRAAQIAACDALVVQNRVTLPIQTEQYRNGELLSKQRTTYKQWPGATGPVLPELIQAAKGGAGLEERVAFTQYDAKGNPELVAVKNGMVTKYIYNNYNQVHVKIENYIYSEHPTTLPSPEESDCLIINAYPSSMVTIYNYDQNTNQIISIVNPNCQKTYYEYDAMHKLKYIRDDNRNILQEFDDNYKP